MRNSDRMEIIMSKSSHKIVVIGGGIAGVGAAVGARKAGADVTLLERTDQLLGVAKVCGGMGLGGRKVQEVELGAMGAPEIDDALKSIMLPTKTKYNAGLLRHSYFDPKAEPTLMTGWGFDCIRADSTIRKLLEEMGVTVRVWSRAVDVAKEDNHITGVKLNDGEWVNGDAFVDCTGYFGTQGKCRKYGGGCVMCWNQCPTFGDRVSVTGKAGAREISTHEPGEPPGSGWSDMALVVYKDSLSPELQKELRETGLIFVKHKGVIDWDSKKAFPGSWWAKNGLDRETFSPLDPRTSKTGIRDSGYFCLRHYGIYATGAHVGPVPLEELRKLEGFENVIVANALGGKNADRMGYDIVLCEDSLRVPGFNNLFCAGSKAGMAEIQTGINSGVHAGHNAARALVGKEPVVLPRNIVTGDFIAFVQESFKTEEGLTSNWGVHGGVFLSRIMDNGMYPLNRNNRLDEDKIIEKVEEAGLTGLYEKKLI